MGSEHKEVQDAAAEHDAQKGETGDSGGKVAQAGHDFRNDAQDLAAQGDKFSQNLTKDWDRDRSEK